MDEINTDYTEDIICPFCGYVFTDSWELDDEAEVDCPECDATFDLEVGITTWYTSSIPFGAER